MWAVFMSAAAAWVLPFVWMVSTSIKPPGEVMTRQVQFIPRHVTIENYIVVFRKPVLRWMFNSLFVTSVVTAGALIIGAMAGYALARLHFPGRHLLFFVMLSSLMIPSEMTMIPMFVAFLKLKLIDHYLALILPPLASVFSVYLFRQFFMGLPYELEDAAAIDGASVFRIFWSVAMPLARSVTIAATVLLFTANWNAFLWPLLITFTEEMKTLPVGMAAFAPAALGRTQIESFAPAMAAMTILGLPSLVVFLLLQRYFMEGVITTGIKG
ncbi:MAG: carbohydrate ABC transporter permease [Anaerolineae bacterium]